MGMHMTWRFVSSCSKKISLVEQFLGNDSVQDVVFIGPRQKYTPSACLTGTLCETLKKLQSYVEVSLDEGRKISDASLWTVYTVIVARRQYTQGGEGIEHYTRAVNAWSGCTHTVHTLIGKLSQDNILKFRLSSTKVKVKRIENHMMTPLSEILYQGSASGGYETKSLFGQHIRNMAGPIGGCEGVPMLPLVHFLGS